MEDDFPIEHGDVPAIAMLIYKRIIKVIARLGSGFINVYIYIIYICVFNFCLFGGMIQFDEHIFQIGWFSHQLVIVLVHFYMWVHVSNGTSQNQLSYSESLGITTC